MNIPSIIFLVLRIIAVVSVIFHVKKRNDYKNDERGQLIIAKASTFSIAGVSFAFLFITLFKYYFVHFFSAEDWFSIATTFMFATCVFANVIGLIYYEKRY